MLICKLWLSRVLPEEAFGKQEGLHAACYMDIMRGLTYAQGT